MKIRALILALILSNPAPAAASSPAAIAAAAGYGPILNPGSPDAAVMIDGRPVQLEYLQCVPALRAGVAHYWEDGSISC